jgi:hypothetical protein
MNKVEVNIEKEMKELFPSTLIKDLQDHERICPVCHGLGMRIDDNIFGLQGDTSEEAKKSRFPYKHQALSFCQHCYNGVQRLCPYCGKPYKNQAYLHCDCEGQQMVDEEKAKQNIEDKLAKAKEVQESEVEEYLYCEEFDKYYPCVDNFFEEYASDDEGDCLKKPEILWVCSVAEISIDADNLIENACDDLHEDAAENCDSASLQELLDKWCKEQSGTTTYYPCYKEYVKIDWSRY